MFLIIYFLTFWFANFKMELKMLLLLSLLVDLLILFLRLVVQKENMINIIIIIITFMCYYY